MLHTHTKKLRLSSGLCLIVALLAPTVAQANTAIVLAAAETGSVAARQAADQKAALAKKAAEREARKAAEAQSATEAKVPVESKATADEHKEK